MTNDIPILESSNPDLTPDEFFDIERRGTCPDCDAELDTGMGFGQRDLECSASCEECDDDSLDDCPHDLCGFFASMRLDRYEEGD